MATAPHSIRRAILLRLALPLALLALAAGALAFVTARHFSAAVLDQWLYDAAASIAGRVEWRDGEPRIDGTLRGGADADPVDRVFYEVLTTGGQRIGGNATLPAPPRRPVAGGTRQLYFGELDGQPVRALAVAFRRDDRAVIVRVAETVQRRTTLARQLLWIGLSLAFVLAGGSAAIVWYGIGRGIASLDVAMRRAREPGTRSGLEPLPLSPDTPVEVQPLVAQINALIEELAGAHRVNERFIVNAAHQLRTPVATLRVQLEAASREADARRRAEHVRDAVDVVAHMSRVLHQLLTLAKADETASDRATRHAPIDLDRIAREEVERRLDEAVALGVDLGYEGSDAPVVVHASEDLVREALANLLDNALRYGGAGGSVTVGVDAGAPALFVEDRGPGIPVEERARVVDRFYRLPGTPGGGCGLGLAIVQEIARLSDATLLLEDGSGGIGLRATLRFAHASTTPAHAIGRMPAGEMQP